MKNWKNAAIFQKFNLHFYTFVVAGNLRGKLLPNKYFYKKHNVEIVKETNGLPYFCTKEKYSCSRCSIKHSHTLLFFARGAPFKSRALARKSRPVCRSCAFSRRNPVLCAFPFFDSYHHRRTKLLLSWKAAAFVFMKGPFGGLNFRSSSQSGFKGREEKSSSCKPSKSRK